MVVRGAYKNREGKVETCYRRKFVIHIERITREKANGKRGCSRAPRLCHRCAGGTAVYDSVFVLKTAYGRDWLVFGG